MKTVAHETTQTMQRVKVGMIGLAAVVLLIGLASAIFSSAGGERPVAVVGAPKAEVVANMAVMNQIAAAPTSEPLAELGLQPSAATANSTVPAQP